MRLIANRTIRDVQVMRSIVDSNRIIAIESDQVGDPDIASADIESVRVEREALPLVRDGINDAVRDIDIASFDLNIPCNGLAGLQTSDAATLDVEYHEMRAAGDAGSIRWVGIPPLLAVRVDPAIVDVLGSGIVDVRALEIEPPDGGGARQDERSRRFDFLGQVQVAVHGDGHVGQIFGEDGLEDVVVDAFFEYDGAACLTVGECRGDGR